MIVFLDGIEEEHVMDSEEDCLKVIVDQKHPARIVFFFFF